MKNRFLPLRILNIILIVALLGVYQMIALDRAEQEAAALAEARAAEAEQRAASGAASIYNDGTYTGTAQGYGGSITVEVTIQNDIITDITPVSHGGEGSAYWDMASGMLTQMVELQDPNVDTVSGATLTSTGIHNAVITALKSALKQ